MARFCIPFAPTKHQMPTPRNIVAVSQPEKFFMAFSHFPIRSQRNSFPQIAVKPRINTVAPIADPLKTRNKEKPFLAVLKRSTGEPSPNNFEPNHSSQTYSGNRSRKKKITLPPDESIMIEDARMTRKNPNTPDIKPAFLCSPTTPFP